jgi:hypothetical protein
MTVLMLRTAVFRTLDLLPTEAPTETVERPDPGLARGLWEAPTWFFYAVVAAAVGLGLLWAIAALRPGGVLGRASRDGRPGSAGAPR